MKVDQRKLAAIVIIIISSVGVWFYANKADACIDAVFNQSLNCGPFPDYGYEYQYEYPTPYTYPTPYAYPTPAYNYPYQYPTPAPVDQCQSSQDCPTYGQPVYDDTGKFCGYDHPTCEPIPGGTAKVCRTSGCGFGINPAPYPTPASNNGNQIPAGSQPQSFDYSLSNSGNSSVTKVSGNAFTQNTISRTLKSLSSQPVNLSLSGLPTGVSYTITNNPCSPSCNSNVTFTVSQSAPVGTHTITVLGSPLGKSTSFSLIISKADLSVSCLANPQSASVNQTVAWSAAVEGGTAPYSYRWSGTNIATDPAPTSTPPFSLSYSTVGTKTLTLTVTDANGLSASCPAASVQINFNPKLQEF